MVLCPREWCLWRPRECRGVRVVWCGVVPSPGPPLITSLPLVIILTHPLVQLIAQVLGQNVPEKMAVMVAGVAKLYVGELIETGTLGGGGGGKGGSSSVSSSSPLSYLSLYSTPHTTTSHHPRHTHTHTHSMRRDGEQEASAPPFPARYAHLTR